MLYGLIVRERGGHSGGGSSRVVDAVSVVVRRRGVENVLREKFKYDLERLPQDNGFAEFDDVPVEGFGEALLAGYGWVEGRGIGRNAKEDVKVKEYTRKQGKGGLGYKEKEKETEKKWEKEDVVVKEEGKVGVGDDVRVVSGRRNFGLKGSVVEMIGRDRLVLKHLITGQELEVQVSDVALLGSNEEEECVWKLKEVKLRRLKEEERRVKDQCVRGKRHEASKNSDWKDDINSSKCKKEDRKPQIKWLVNHIKVRVISKDVKGGRLYCKKGKVVDVVGPMTCDICMDDRGELIQGVNQELLETAIPRPGGPVMVLYGDHKGVYGTLMERDSENETVVVRDEDSHSLITVGLEQIAEYVGDPAELGY